MPYLTPDAAPGDTVCRMLVIPNDKFWISIVNGALSELVYSYRFEQFGSATPEETAARFAQMFDEYLASEFGVTQIFPVSHVHFHQRSRVVVGNAIAIFANSALHFAFHAGQSAAAIHDQFEFDVLLESGTYNMTVLYSKNTDRGILALSVSGDATNYTLDTYGASAGNQYATFTVTIDVSGIHLVTGKVDSKNAASSGYAALLTAIFFDKQ